LEDHYPVLRNSIANFGYDSMLNILDKIIKACGRDEIAYYLIDNYCDNPKYPEYINVPPSLYENT
jgi:hypothetical protein